MSAFGEFARRWLRMGGPLVAALATVACSDDFEPPTRFGVIYLNSDPKSEPTQAASAFFYRVSAQAPASNCYVVDRPTGCQLWHCEEYEPSAAEGIAPLSAGSLSVTGGSVELMFDETEPGRYVWENTLQAPLWQGGEQLSATLSGSLDFPNATVRVIAPDPIAVSAPAVPAEGWQLDPLKDLGLAWSGAIRSDVYISIWAAVAAADDGRHVFFPALDCGFVGTTGAGYVPASLLQRVPKPASGVGHHVSILTFGSSSLGLEDARLELRATSVGLSSLATLE